MKLGRYPLLLFALFGLITGSAAQAAEASVILSDIKGRTVSLDQPARRLVVDDGRMILALSFLTKDPVGIVAAWPHDVDRFGREIYAGYQKLFPAIDTLPRTASNAQDVNVEQILAIAPDAVLASSFSHLSEQQVEQLQQAGIPVIFVDFVTDPLNNTDRSLAIMGQAIGRVAEASRIIRLREEAKAAIRARVGAAGGERPSILMEPHASTSESCCNSPGAAGIGKFLEFVGARNIGEVIGKRPSGKLDLEYVISAEPQIYIATGGEYMKERGGLRIGPSFTPDETSRTMSALLARPGFSAMALKSGAIHGISQQVFSSPLDILALELLAKWCHPDLFADLDVEGTRREMNALMAVPLEGTYWTQ